MNLAPPPLVVALPGNGALAALIAERGAERAPLTLRRFPDGESFVSIEAPLRGREVMIACTLHHPDELLIPLALVAHTARDLGARRVRLVAPYLSYMRQDERFAPGQGVSSRYIASMLSSWFDALTTVDPHLHRHASLEEIYSIPARVVASAPALAAWVRAEVERPVIVGPDAESAQWVEPVAALCEAPYVLLEKTRRGDRDVMIAAHDARLPDGRTPVILDDIVSTGRTMACALEWARDQGAPAPWCVGVHAVFSDDATALLLGLGARGVVTTNTIEHPSNAIDALSLIAEAL